MSTASPPPKVACPHCQALIKAPALAAGSTVNCPKCGKAFRLGEAAGGQKAEVGGQRSEVGGRGSGAKERLTPTPPKAERPSGTQYSVPSTPPLPPTRAAQAPPVPPPAAAIADSRPAPADSAHTNPKSRPLDNLVDPNLLPPPPPVVKPKPKQVAVVCSLCGTRLYAPLEKIGQTIKCPDCHTVNEIKAAEQKEQKTKGPTLEDVEEVALSDPGQRPAYRPLVATRGEYEILSALDPNNVSTGWQLPKAPPGGSPAAEEDDEFQLEAPVERVSLAPEPVKMPLPEPDQDPEEKLRDGRYDDGLIGENVDRRDPEAWKKSPFLIGVVEFLIQPETLGRVAAYCAGLALLLNIGGLLATAARSEEVSWKLATIVLSMFTAVGFGIWIMPFATTMLAVVQDTGNGAKEVNNWPTWDPTEWFFPSLFVGGAALASGLPGMLVTTALFGTVIASSSLQSSVVAAGLLSLPLPLSWLALFPLVLYSMLAENSILAVFSRHTLASLRVAAEGWMLFYMFSVLLCLVAGAAGTLIFFNNFIALTLGAIGLVITAFLYARLLGRLMWYGNQQLAKSDHQMQPR